MLAVALFPIAAAVEPVATFLPPVSGGSFGSSVAVLPDVDGDGLPDVAVGAPSANRSMGWLGVLAGADGSVLTELYGENGGGVGKTVSSSPDLFGNALPSLILGTSDVDLDGGGVPNDGGALMVGLDLADLQLTTLIGTNSDYLGLAVLSFDHDLDGRGEVLVSTGGPSGDGRVVYSDDGALWTTWDDGTSTAYFGYYLAVADFDGDGLGDMAVAAPGVTVGPVQFGRVYVYAGTVDGFSPTATSFVQGTIPDGLFGYTLTSGDFNGDGYGDVAVGDYASVGDTAHVTVFHGSPAGLSAAPAVVLDGPGGVGFGEPLLGLEDFNGDGYGDLAVSAPYAVDVDEVWLYLGSASGLPTTPDLVLSDGSTADAFGAGLGAGDLNLDGLTDLLVGAPLGARYDGAVRVFTGFIDADEDGFPGVGYGYPVEDCDDADPLVFPGAVEVCDAADVDEDCDGLADNADPSADTTLGVDAWRDDDGDGYGVGDPVRACDVAPPYADRAGDCDDADPAVSPAADEVCGGADDDCDGLVDAEDDSLTGPDVVEAFVDADADGYGADGSAYAACADSAPVTAAGDCDDADPAVNPDGVERCAEGDEDCDGLDGDADDSVSDAVVGHADGDGDGFGAAEEVTTCVAVDDGTDCDDGRADVYPGAADAAGDGVDADCDGVDPEPKGNCGCAADPSPAVALGGLPAALLVVRRRRSAARP